MGQIVKNVVIFGKTKFVILTIKKQLVTMKAICSSLRYLENGKSSKGINLRPRAMYLPQTCSCLDASIDTRTSPFD
jgi:hypothetical protein